MNHPQKRAGRRAHEYEGLLFSFLALIVILLYAETLTGPFIFDDKPNILENSHIRLSELTVKDLARAAFKSPIPRRPLANISFALNYYFHRYNPVGYHLVNIVIHILNGILLFLLAKTTLHTPCLRSDYEKYRWIPFFSALLWLVHPLQTQSVAYIVQRMNSLATLFYILSILFYAKSRLESKDRSRKLLLAGCILSGLFALGSKEISATLPFFIILYEWYFFQDLSRTWVKRHALIFAGVLGLLILIALIYLGTNPVDKILAGYKRHSLTPSQRVLTEFRVVIFYISQLMWPHPSRLNLVHDFPPSVSFLNPITTLFSVAAVGAMIAFGIVIARKQRLLSYCILWYFGNLVIESSVLRLEIIFEHRNYLPSMFVMVGLVATIFRYLRFKAAAMVVICAISAVAALWTFERNTVWQNAVTLWQDCASKSPRQARPFNNLGSALIDQGRIEEAIVQFDKAIELKPDYGDAHYNLGYALARAGKPREAIRHLTIAVGLEPENYMAHNNLGVALLLQDDLDDAIYHFREALRLKPNFVDALNNLGVALKHQGNYAEAINHFTEALRINPDFAEARRNLDLTIEETNATASGSPADHGP